MPGADVEELADARLGGQEPHGAAEEGAVLAGDGPGVRLNRDHRAGGVLVGSEIVVPAQPPVVDPGDVGLAGVDVRRHPARLHCHRVSRPAVAVTHAGFSVAEPDARHAGKMPGAVRYRAVPVCGYPAI